MATIEKIKKEGLMDFDFERKMGEVTSGGMAGLINGNIAFLNAKWGVSARQKVRVVWHTHIGAAVGFSEIAEGLIPELHKLGFDVYVNDWSNGTNVSDPLIKELIDKTEKAKASGDDLQDAVHVVCWLMETFADVDGVFKVGISFCESTNIRDSYLHLCNGMDSIMTFSEFCKTVQKSSGFTAPIHVAIPGVDQTYIKYHDREMPPKIEGNAERNDACPCGSGQKFKKCCMRKKFTFLSVGVAQERKDTRRLVGAFCEAFPKGASRPPECEEGFPLSCDQVELVLKSNNFGELDWVEPFKQKANIRTVFTGWHEKADTKDLSKDEMYDLYCQADALVHPSHGEGIGMPILEGAATGLPVIFTNWSSPAEYLDDSNSYPCSLSPYAGTTFTKAYPGAPGDNGMWANIHIGHLKHNMYEVIRNNAGAKAKGAKAHEDIKNRFNWQESARDLWPVIMGWHEKKEAKPKMEDEDFNALTFVKPNLEKVSAGDRIMIDITTRDRRPYIACLLTSLLAQTYKNWDISIQVDDADEGILQDHLVMSLIKRIELEGHTWRMIRGMRQGPHMSHQRNLQAVVDAGMSHKLICRIDDDIYVQPDFLEKLFEQFLQDEACELGAVSGVYLNPTRTDAEQTAPANFREDINYAGKIDHNVPWPYTCRYPEGTKPRSVEHLYSSFLYRTEIAHAIGGYCKLFSQIGHREESDFSYRFHLAGYKLLIHPDAVGYHFYAPGSGIRSVDISEKEAHAETDHKIYSKRLAKWKAQLKERHDREAKRIEEISALQDVNTMQEALAKAHVEPKDDIACIVNGEDDLESVVDAVERFAPMVDSVYVMCGIEDTESVVKGIKTPGILPKIKMIGGSLRDMAQVFNAAWASGSEYVMTVSDQMRFQSDPRPILSKDHDEYVFEVYSTYERGHSNGNGFEADEDAPEVIGPECRNMCLISRNNGNGKVPMERRLYSDLTVFDDQRITREGQGKSVMGNPLIRVDEMDKADWTKVCVFQHPNGRCDPPNTQEVIIIPTPGRRDYLKKCIDSIYSLTSTSFELIIIDNDSSDGTAEMLAEQQKTRPGIQVYRQETNLGYQKSINIAVDRSKGKYLLLFNDDAWVDQPEPNGSDWLQVLIDELESDPKIGLVGPHAGESPALKKPMLFFWCVMMRRSTWDEIGALDDVTFLNYGGDDDYCERLRMAGYEIRQKYVHLRHLMNLVPPEVKNPELAESRMKLLNKYSVGV
jgi:GT2 family glycosyltransferase/glycosyltransferase involved in cell wall biosynthesis